MGSATVNQTVHNAVWVRTARTAAACVLGGAPMDRTACRALHDSDSRVALGSMSYDTVIRRNRVAAGPLGKGRDATGASNRALRRRSGKPVQGTASRSAPCAAPS
jgi:hypothetical protein